jgi:hypothetical protein
VFNIYFFNVSFVFRTKIRIVVGYRIKTEAHLVRTKDIPEIVFTEPGKLYESYRVLGADSLTIHSVPKDQINYLTPDVFNKNGNREGESTSAEMKLDKKVNKSLLN